LRWVGLFWTRPVARGRRARAGATTTRRLTLPRTRRWPRTRTR